MGRLQCHGGRSSGRYQYVDAAGICRDQQHVGDVVGSGQPVKQQLSHCHPDGDSSTHARADGDSHTHPRAHSDPDANGRGQGVAHTYSPAENKKKMIG